MKKTWRILWKSLKISVLLLALLFAIWCALMVYARLYLIYGGPLEQEGAVWISEDGRITFTVGEIESEGKIQLENEIVEFDIHYCDGGEYVALGVPGRDETLEVWIWDRKSSSEYEMTVIYSYTGYFTEGETITFYCADSIAE